MLGMVTHSPGILQSEILHSPAADFAVGKALTWGPTVWDPTVWGPTL